MKKFVDITLKFFKKFNKDSSSGNLHKLVNCFRSGKNQKVKTKKYKIKKTQIGERKENMLFEIA